MDICLIGNQPTSIYFYIDDNMFQLVGFFCLLLGIVLLDGFENVHIISFIASYVDNIDLWSCYGYLPLSVWYIYLYIFFARVIISEKIEQHIYLMQSLQLDKICTFNKNANANGMWFQDFVWIQINKDYNNCETFDHLVCKSEAQL